MLSRQEKEAKVRSKQEVQEEGVRFMALDGYAVQQEIMTDSSRVDS
jgi:hypothetical protein